MCYTNCQATFLWPRRWRSLVGVPWQIDKIVKTYHVVNASMRCILAVRFGTFDSHIYVVQIDDGLVSRIAARCLSPTHWQLLLQLQPLGIGMLLNGLYMLGRGPYWPGRRNWRHWPGQTTQSGFVPKLYSWVCLSREVRLGSCPKPNF